MMIVIIIVRTRVINVGGRPSDKVVVGHISWMLAASSLLSKQKAGGSPADSVDNTRVDRAISAQFINARAP